MSMTFVHPVLSVVLVLQPAPLADRPAPTKAGPPVAAAVENTRFATAEALLDALETADKGLRSLTAEIQYTKVFPEIVGGEKQIRRGKLTFAERMLDDETPIDPTKIKPGEMVVRAGVPARAFSIVFTQLIVDEAVREDSKQFIFDGRWLIERNEKERQFFKRRLVAPGEVADPLKIGEGPFPIPIGQKKADMVARFEASVAAPLDGLEDKVLPDSLKGTVQLVLKPREGTTEARDFADIRVWYRLSDLLPRRARTTNIDGSSTDVLLINQEKNKPVDDAAFSIEPPNEPGWDIDIRSDVRKAGGK
ncbi:MAG: LolA family protein [Phycisphaerales bacterium]